MLYSTFAVAALAGASLVGAAPVINARKAAPTGWAHQVLEDYNAYHVRYLALECYKQHNTDFFDQCCRPLRATQSLENDRPEQCRPSPEALASAQSKVDSRVSPTASSGPDASGLPTDDAGAEYVSVAFDAPTSITDAAPTETPTQDAPKDTPAPTTTDAPTETPTETTTETTKTTTTTDEPAPTPTDDGNNGNNNNNGGAPAAGSHNGKGTWYLQSEGADDSGLGSCGMKNSDSEFIAAVSTTHGSDWGLKLCGQWLMVKNNANGKTVKVKAVDSCPTCETADSLDLSKPAFEAIADADTGVIDITWWQI